LQDIYKPYKKIKKLKLLIIPAVIIGLLIIVGLFSAIYIKKTVESPNSTESTKKSFSVKSGQSLDEIAKNLETAKLIKSDFVFSLYMKASKRAKKIQAGDYQIPANLNMKDVAGIITFGQVNATKITIPEGCSRNRWR
jgi:cell division protein YceG involved in septum cleavage